METPTVPQTAESARESEPRSAPALTDTPPSGGYNTSAAPPYQPPYGPPYGPSQPAPRSPRNHTPWIVGGVVAVVLLIGLIATLLIALVYGLTLGVGSSTMRSSVSTQTLQVQGTPTVTVTTAAGAVHITTGAASAVTVQVTKHVRAVDGPTAQRAFDSMRANITQQGNTVTITSDFSPALMQARSVDYAITLPAGSVVRANVSAGNIDVTNTTGPLALTTSAGNVTVTNVRFGQGSSLRASAGNVNASGSIAPGAFLDIQVSAGNATLDLPATTATHLTAGVSVGNLTITGFPVSVSKNGLTGRYASGDTGPNPQGSVNVTVSTGNLIIAAR